MRTLLLTLSLCLFSAPVVASDEAEPVQSPNEALPAELAGVWRLDHEASDPLEPLLVALGRSRMERTMARRLGQVTHTISLGEDWIEVTNSNAFRSQTSRLALGQSSTVDSMGQTMEVEVTLEQGRVCTRGGMEVDGEPAVMETSRGLTDSDTMELVVTLRPTTGEPVMVRRLFRRS